MALGAHTLDSKLGSIDSTIGGLVVRPSRRAAIDRWRADVAAARFHLNRPEKAAPLIAILGGTGTGKSTLLNRLLGADLSSTSFKRTFTAGPIAVAGDVAHVPPGWLGVEHQFVDASQLPASGRLDQLMIASVNNDLTGRITLIDTPDLDGDQPAHHVQADRVFRWADAILFLVTPEKYQMTELLPYYRLARRYGVPTIYVMNKVEERAVVDDYRSQGQCEIVYCIPRDDAAYEPPAEVNLDALRVALKSVAIERDADSHKLRAGDLMDRLRDQIIEPARHDRREVDRLTRSLRAMETPSPGVDVNPLTQQLQRRLQQRSVLYLMGPGRMLDRVRQVPGLLARLPRTTWDLLRSGRMSGGGNGDLPNDISREAPNFRAALVDQFTVVQSRIDDLVRSGRSTAQWTQDADYASSKLPPDSAGQIADQEIAKLREFLEHQWNATPRDTAMIQRLLKVLPGGEKLAKWSEAAPYILAIIVAAHGAVFGHLDLMILGGYSIATWLSEKLSNQVAARARAANATIGMRFTELAHQQIEQTITWLDRQAPRMRDIDRLGKAADEISDSLQLSSTGKG